MKNVIHELSSSLAIFYKKRLDKPSSSMARKGLGLLGHVTPFRCLPCPHACKLQTALKAVVEMEHVYMDYKMARILSVLEVKPPFATRLVSAC